MALLKLSSEIRKEQLIHAALAVLSREGVPGLSMARVAREVGIVPSAVYRHFKSKEELVQALMQHIQTNIYGYISETIEKTPDPLERLRKILLIHTKFIASNKGLPSLVFSEGLFSSNPHRREISRGITQGYLQRISSIIKLGQVEKKIRTDLRPKIVALIFAGLIQSPAIMFHLSDGTFDIQKQARQAWKLFSGMIKA